MAFPSDISSFGYYLSISNGFEEIRKKWILPVHKTRKILYNIDWV